MDCWLREDTKLTTMLKNLFGKDVVEEAFKVGWHKEEDLEKFQFVNKKEPCLDGETILIRMRNGKEVIMSNSEWGGVHKPRNNDRYFTL